MGPSSALALPDISRHHVKGPKSADIVAKVEWPMKKEPDVSLSGVFSAWHDPAARMMNVDLLTVLVAVLLPWSTSGVVIAAVLWVLALVPTLELRPFLLSLNRPISALPIALFVLALGGTLWSDASWSARLDAVGPTVKFLALPLLFYHFERSTRGLWVFIAFLASCTLLMAASWVVAFDPSLTLKPEAKGRGLFVKNYIDQSQEFALCAVALAYPVLVFLRANRTPLAALLTALALGFVANMMFVVVSRTTLVTMPIMLAIFALFHLRYRTIIAVVCAVGLIATLVWNASPSLRATASSFVSDYQYSKIRNNSTGLGSRLEYWQKSFEFFADAPLIGHGSGSTRGLFEQAAIGETGVQAEIVGNPHNQTLNVAVQWGVIGIIVLYAMWLFHLLLFRGEGFVTWVGLLVVIQNVLTSLLNSHLFDFVEGWMYVLGVGVAGGMTLATLPNSGSPQANSFAAKGSFSKQAISKVLIGFTILAALLFGTLYFIISRQPQADSPLAVEVKAIAAALDEYRVSRGAYPISEIPLTELAKKLAKEGNLPTSGDLGGVYKEAYYLSINGKSYGLFFHIDRTDDNPSGTVCMVQVGRSYLGGMSAPPCFP
jgi:O-antigen ligase